MKSFMEIALEQCPNLTETDKNDLDLMDFVDEARETVYRKGKELSPKNLDVEFIKVVESITSTLNRIGMIAVHDFKKLKYKDRGNRISVLWPTPSNGIIFLNKETITKLWSHSSVMSAAVLMDTKEIVVIIKKPGE